MDENRAPADAAGAADGAPVPDPLHAAVERWWNDHFPGSPVAQVTQAWNHAFAAKEALKRLLAGAVERNPVEGDR